MKTIITPCWNCKSEKEPIKSTRTGIDYCADCLCALSDPRRSLAGLVEVVNIREESGVRSEGEKRS